MKGIIWLNDAVIAEIPKPPMRHGEVLGKMVGASFTHVEKLIALGSIPTDVGRVLGSIGIIKAIDASSDLDSKLIGRYFILLPRHDYIGGIDFDGVLADYASIPLKLLMPISEYYASRPETLVYAELSFIHETIDYVKNKNVLIIGCGPTSYIIANHIKDLCNVHVTCIHNQPIRSKIAELGIYVANYNNLDTYRYDVVILLTTSTYLLLNTLRMIKDLGYVIIPPNIPRVLLGTLSVETDVNVVKFVFPKHRLDGGVFEVFEKYLKDLRKLVSVTNNFEEAMSGVFHFWRSIVYRRPEDDA
ncbi:MAG: hypothetical protein QXZ63_05705 [Sulfolobales archaeon]